MDKAHMDTFMTKVHGKKADSMIMAHQGANAFFSGSSQFPAQNPITKSGGRVLEAMKEQYGEKKGKQVFYASINAHKKGSKKWHK